MSTTPVGNAVPGGGYPRPDSRRPRSEWPGSAPAMFPAWAMLAPLLARVEPLLRARWPEPAAPNRRVLWTALLVGLLAAVLIPGVPRPGVNVAGCGLAVAIGVGLLTRAEGVRRGRARPVGRVALALGTVAVALAGVSAVRASEWLTWVCVAAAGCLGAGVVLDARRWNAVIVAVPVFGVALLRSLPWARRSLRLDDAVRGRSRPWLTGLAIGLIFMLAVAGLLASADDTFGRVFGDGLSVVTANLTLVRIAVFGIAVGTALAAAFAVSTQVAWPRSAQSRRPARHPAEWLLPLALVGMTIAGFLAIEATRLFGGAEVVLREPAVSHADRAREGFGQLTVVTLIVVGLLSWAGGQAGRGPAVYRRLMAGFGGTLLALTLLLAASAIRRLWLYQDAYGWTVTRLVAGAFEIWVTIVLLAIAVGWTARRSDLLPRIAIGSAGLGLLLVSLAGPDALVAAGNVNRFERTGSLDIDYLSTLSADAVPALNRLPEPQRSCTLNQQKITHDPWPGWNRARARANHLLTVHPADPTSAC